MSPSLANDFDFLLSVRPLFDFDGADPNPTDGFVNPRALDGCVVQFVVFPRGFPPILVVIHNDLSVRGLLPVDKRWVWIFCR